MNKTVTITIRFDNKQTLSLRLTCGLFRKVGLYVNGKFEKFVTVTKVVNKIRKIIVEYFTL
jgi:hypothetical protein